MQGTIDERRAPGGGVGEDHAHPRVGRRTGRAPTGRAGTRLGRDLAGLRPLLQEAGLIDDEHAARHLAEVLDDLRSYVVPHGVGIPDRAMEAPLRAERIALPHRLRQLPTILASHPCEQPGEVAADALAHRHPPEAARDQ